MKHILAIVLGLAVIAIPLITGALTIDDPLGDKTIGELLEGILNFLVVVGGAVAVIMIIYAGIIMVTAGDNKDKVGQAKKTIIWALVGYAIIISAKFIIMLVESLLKQ